MPPSSSGASRYYPIAIASVVHLQLLYMIYRTSSLIRCVCLLFVCVCGCCVSFFLMYVYFFFLGVPVLDSPRGRSPRFHSGTNHTRRSCPTAPLSLHGATHQSQSPILWWYGTFMSHVYMYLYVDTYILHDFANI
jgi:hypothetical protein